jgi:cytochrome d ubiquinol oxidase subunit II
MNYYGGLFPLLNPYAVLGGLVFVSLFTMHGANFLKLKAPKEIAERANKVGFVAWIVATVLTVAFVVWTFFATDILTKSGINGLIPAALAAVALLVTGWLAKTGKEKWAFVTGSLTVIFATIMVFAGLFPRILISSLDPALSLTITNASSSPYTLKIMTIVAAIFVPIVLVYLGWTYWVFRKRVTTGKDSLIY